ncbi:MAG TPA: cation:proton antiporter [Kofleriaceae bacterium]|nr:cation:proton antiporter [Kofleriaceae bacterium]
MTASRILVELVVVLGTAAVVTVVFQALHMPVVLGYVLAGLVIGPHVPVPLVADAELVHVLSQLGVILLMFTIGLELPLRTIARVGIPGALTALFEVGLVVAVGTLVATALGFDPALAVFAGACLGISSTMLVAKAFDELGWKGGFTEVVFAILVFEDVIAIVLLAVVTAVATGTGLDAGALATLLGKLLGLLAVMLVGGLLVLPRAIRWVAVHARKETLLISSLVVCFGMSMLADRAGYSVALGAFIAGVLIAESGHGETVAHMVEPFRDVFAMVFFVSVGMSIDPGLLASEWLRIAAFTCVVLLVKPLGVTVGVFLAGHGILPAIRAGLSLAQIGEFSFVIAGVLASPQLLAIAVGVSCATTLISPLLIRNAQRIGPWLAGRLPGGVATFVSFYESWLERLRAQESPAWGRHRRTVIVLALDAAALVAVLIAGSTIGARGLDDLGLTGAARTALQVGVTGALAAPFAISIVRRVAVVAHRLAVEVIPAGSAMDLGRAPRHALVVTLELALALAIIVPIVALLQPFLPGSFAILLAGALVLVLVMRRSIADFSGHVRASSEVLVELLSGPEGAQQLSRVATILPGLSAAALYTIPEGADAVGRSLAQLDLRARTGATVLAIGRGVQGLASPPADEPLCAGDQLALAGSDEAVAAAKAMLGAGSAS